MALKGVLVDLDNTLYEYGPANDAGNAAALEHIARALALPKKNIEKAFGQAKAEVKEWAGNTSASHSRLLYFKRLVEMETGCTRGQLALEAEDVFWDAFLNGMRPKPGAGKFLSLLKEEGLKVVVVSDLTCQIQLRKLLRLGLEDKVDLLVTSEEAGAEKPGPRIFQLALKRCGLQAGQVVLIGDDDGRDRVGANKMNIAFKKVDSFGNPQNLLNELRGMA